MMTKRMLLTVFSMAAGLVCGCGAPGDEAITTANGGLSDAHGSGGARRRTSSGREGYERDLAYFRQRLQELQTAPGAGKEQLAAGIGKIVAQLEGLKVQSGPQTMDEVSDYVCGANYTLDAEVFEGMAYGTSQASASYSEFGPPSPWSKSLFTYAVASGGGYTDQQDFWGTFSGVGSFSVPTASAEAGPAFCQDLFAYSYIQANGCTNGFRSQTAESPSCE